MSLDLPARQTIERLIAQQRIIEEQRDKAYMRCEDLARELKAAQKRTDDARATIRTLVDLLAQHAQEASSAVWLGEAKETEQ